MDFHLRRLRQHNLDIFPPSLFNVCLQKSGFESPSPQCGRIKRKVPEWTGGRMREGAVFFEAFKESQSRRRCNYYEELMFPPPLTSPSVRTPKRPTLAPTVTLGGRPLSLPFGLPLCPRMPIHGDDDELFHLVGRYVLLPLAQFPSFLGLLLRQT